MISACVDTNILISFLLAPMSASPPSRIMRHALSKTFQLVIVETTIHELLDKVGRKPYLMQRITDGDVAVFLNALDGVARVLPTPAHPLPTITRDPRDDYLVVPAVLAAVDMVVSGDKDLLVIGQIVETRIVSPATFVALLDRLSAGG